VADIESYDLAALGPGLETDPIFPQKANISLAQVLAPDHIRLGNILPVGAYRL
jgi:diaminopimelate epimerase